MDEIIGKANEYWRNAGYLRLGHYMAAEKTSRKHKLIGIPSVALSAVVATSVFSTMTDEVDVAFRVLTGVIALLAAVLASLQTFLNFSDLAERHRMAAARYFSARRRLDIFMLSFASMADDAAESLEERRELALQGLREITEELGSLSSESPTLNEATYRRAAKAFNDAHPQEESEPRAATA